MARTCKKCGERLYSTDTFCGFCGESCEDAVQGIDEKAYAPRPLVGAGSLSTKERDKIEKTKVTIKNSPENIKKAEEAKLRAAEKIKAERIEALKKEEAATKKKTVKRIVRKSTVVRPVQIDDDDDDDDVLVYTEALDETVAETSGATVPDEKKEVQLEENFAPAEQTKPEPEAPAPEVKVSEPTVEAKAPEVKVSAPTVEAKAPEVKVSAPVVETPAPEVKVSAPVVETPAPEVKVESTPVIPEVEATPETPEEEAPTEDFTVDVDEVAEAMESEISADDEIVDTEDESSDGNLEELSEQLKQAIEEANRLDEQARIAEAEASAASYAAKLAGDQAIQAKAKMVRDRDQFEEEDFVPKKVTRTDNRDMVKDAEKRAREEQRDYEKVLRKKKGDRKTKKRDIVLLVVGIIILLGLLAFMLFFKKDIPGNDSLRPSEAPSISQGAAEYTDGPDLVIPYSEGDGSENSPFVISTPAHLRYLAKEVNRGISYSGFYFSLSDDIDLGGYEWTPAGFFYAGENGDLIYAFSGTLLGNNHTIKNYKITDKNSVSAHTNCSSNLVAGLFGAVYNATIKDLNVEGATVAVEEESTGSFYAGGFAGYMGKSTLENVKVVADVSINGSDRSAAGVVAGVSAGGKVSTVTADGNVNVSSTKQMADAGLLFGFSEFTEIEIVQVTGDVKAHSYYECYIGGAVGYAKALVINDLKATATVSSNCDSVLAEIMMGGLAGSYYDSNDYGSEVDVKLNAAGKNYIYAGGLLGYAANATSTSAMITAKIDAASESIEGYVLVGGVAGISNQCNLTEVKSDVEYKGESLLTGYAGGVAGFSKNSIFTTVRVDNAGDVTVTDAENSSLMVGGISGKAEDVTAVDVNITGTIKAHSKKTSYLGGAFGLTENGSFTSITATVKLENTCDEGVATGGLIGKATGKYTIEECEGTKERVNEGRSVYDNDIIAIK